jgi:hypothetical protein
VEIEFKHRPTVKDAAGDAVRYKYMSRIVAGWFG